MDANNLLIHNKYTFTLLDKSGNVKEQREALNVANSSRYIAACMAADWPGYKYDPPMGYSTDSSRRMQGITGISLGSGTEPEPSEDDAHLIAENTAFQTGLKFTRVNIPEKYGDSVHFTASATYGASSSYVGTLTEVGLGTAGWLYSHAWISDLEGTRMPITKTALDILIVTVDVYFTLSLPVSTPSYVSYFPVWSTGICDALPTLGGRTVYFSPAYAPPANGNICISTPNTTCRMAALTCNAGVTCVNDDGTQSNALDMQINNSTFETASENIGYMHSIIVDKHAIISLPNEAICPAYAYNDIAIGTGDGITTKFSTQVNQVKSCKIYVDGAEDATAYLVQGDVTKSPCWNKCIGVYEAASVDDGTYTKWHSLPEVGDPTESYNRPIAMSALTFASKGSYLAPSATCNVPNGSHVGSAAVYYDAAGITIDHVYIGGYNGEYGAVSGGVVLEYTNDDITDFLNDDINWTTVSGIKAGVETTTYFAPITAKYWRLAGMYRYCSTARMTALDVANLRALRRSGIDNAFIILGNSTVNDFGKMGVNFATAPASGAVITMDAVLNLPLKCPDTQLTFSYATSLTV